MLSNGRILKELTMFEMKSCPPGINCWKQNPSDLKILEGSILGPQDTPFHGGVFKLSINVPDNYPFSPPNVTFITPIYHPNIDESGRICLDLLKTPPKGSWKPSINLLSLLTSIRLLMSDPNPDDPLVAEIAELYKVNREEFNKVARKWTDKYAIPSGSISGEET